MGYGGVPGTIVAGSALSAGVGGNRVCGGPVLFVPGAQEVKKVGQLTPA